MLEAFFQQLCSAADLLCSPTENRSGQERMNALFVAHAYPTLQQNLLTFFGSNPVARIPLQHCVIASSMFQKSVERDSGLMSTNDLGSLVHKLSEICHEWGPCSSAKTLSACCGFLLKVHAAGAPENIRDVENVLRFQMEHQSRLWLTLDLLNVFSNQTTTPSSMAMPFAQHEELRLLFTLRSNSLFLVFEKCVLSIRSGGRETPSLFFGLLHRCLIWNYDTVCSDLQEVASDVDLAPPERINFPHMRWVQYFDRDLVLSLVATLKNPSDRECRDDAGHILLQLCGARCGDKENFDFISTLLRELTELCDTGPLNQTTSFCHYLYAHCLLRALHVHGVILLLRSVPYFCQAVIPFFVSETCCLLNMTDHECEDDHDDALQSALGVWSLLLSTICVNPTYRAQYYDAIFARIAAEIFHVFVTSPWRDHEDLMRSVALLARENAPVCISYLDETLVKSFQLCISGNTKSFTSFVCLCAYVLADEHEGEVPAIPSCFSSIALGLIDVSWDHHIALRHLMHWCAVTMQVLNSLPESAFLPLLSFFTRVSATYADPDEDIQSDAIPMFSDPNISCTIAHTVIALASASLHFGPLSSPACDMLRVFQGKKSLHALFSASLIFKDLLVRSCEDVAVLTTLFSIACGDRILPELTRIVARPQHGIHVLSELCMISKGHYVELLPFIMQREDSIFCFDSLSDVNTTIRILTCLATASASFCTVFMSSPFDRFSREFRLPENLPLDSNDYHAIVASFMKLVQAMSDMCSCVDVGSEDERILTHAFRMCLFKNLFGHFLSADHDRYEYMVLHTPEIQFGLVQTAAQFISVFGMPSDAELRAILEHILLRVALNSNVRGVPAMGYKALVELVENENVPETFLEECGRVVVLASLSCSDRNVSSSLATAILQVMGKLGTDRFFHIVCAHVDAPRAISTFREITQAYVNMTSGPFSRKAVRDACAHVEGLLFGLHRLRLK